MKVVSGHLPDPPGYQGTEKGKDVVCLDHYFQGPRDKMPRCGRVKAQRAREKKRAWNSVCPCRQDLGGKEHVQSSSRDFPGGPVLRTACFHCRGCGFYPSSGN